MHGLLAFALWKVRGALCTKELGIPRFLPSGNAAGDDLRLLVDGIHLSGMSSGSSHVAPRGGWVSVCMPSSLLIGPCDA